MKRPVNLMPEDVRMVLEDESLRALYDARPWYQRNDYLGWIARAKRQDTKEKRLSQMIGELRAGNVYMKMAWQPKA